MADPVISATVQVVLDKLLSLTIEEAKNLGNCKKDLRMLTNYVSMIQDFIHDAERRQVEDQALEKWLKMLERVAEDAEYVFDEFIYASLKAQVMKNRTKLTKKAYSSKFMLECCCGKSQEQQAITLGQFLCSLNVSRMKDFKKDMNLMAESVPLSLRMCLPVSALFISTDSCLKHQHGTYRNVTSGGCVKKLSLARETAFCKFFCIWQRYYFPGVFRFIKECAG